VFKASKGEGMMELQKLERGVKMEQQKISMEFKLSKNYNSVMLGIQDEPIVFGNDDELRKAIRKIARILREEVEHQLSLIGTKEGDANAKMEGKLQ